MLHVEPGLVFGHPLRPEIGIAEREQSCSGPRLAIHEDAGEADIRKSVGRLRLDAGGPVCKPIPQAVDERAPREETLLRYEPGEPSLGVPGRLEVLAEVAGPVGPQRGGEEETAVQVEVLFHVRTRHHGLNVGFRRGVVGRAVHRLGPRGQIGTARLCHPLVTAVVLDPEGRPRFDRGIDVEFGGGSQVDGIEGDVGTNVIAEPRVESARGVLPPPQQVVGELGRVVEADRAAERQPGPGNPVPVYPGGEAGDVGPGAGREEVPGTVSKPPPFVVVIVSRAPSCPSRRRRCSGSGFAGGSPRSRH